MNSAVCTRDMWICLVAKGNRSSFRLGRIVSGQTASEELARPAAVEKQKSVSLKRLKKQN